MIITEEKLANVSRAFYENFEQRGEIGASLSIWKDGEEILNLADGWKDKTHKTQTQKWNSDTLIPVYSATKGPASATFLKVIENAGFTPETKVQDIWEDFPITIYSQPSIAELMSHQCGLPALDNKVSVFDFEAVIEAIEAQPPAWSLGDAHGYHPRTYGFLLDKLCLCLTGEKIAPMFHKLIAEPLKLDFWIGLPEEQHHKVGTLYPGKMTKADMESGFYQEFNQSDSLVRKTFASPVGLQAVQDMNTPAAWQSGLPAMGGVGTASSLAKFYQAAIGTIGTIGATRAMGTSNPHLTANPVPLFSDNLRKWMSTPVVSGDDLILCTPTQFSCGFQLDPLDSLGNKIRNNYGDSQTAFGHPGAGGSHGFGDPEHGISFAYVMNQMEISVLPNKKTMALVAALYE
ncbi:beta-lactamase family protein [Akkermansiaceae bacterium]|nr:beta-lactamase family protein [Akkermansiaceae bacterium]